MSFEPVIVHREALAERRLLLSSGHLRSLPCNEEVRRSMD
jgi:hypothetical protein